MLAERLSRGQGLAQKCHKIFAYCAAGGNFPALAGDDDDRLEDTTLPASTQYISRLTPAAGLGCHSSRTALCRPPSRHA